jgi:hypothetical protein
MRSGEGPVRRIRQLRRKPSRRPAEPPVLGGLFSRLTQGTCRRTKIAFPGHPLPEHNPLERIMKDISGPRSPAI